MARSLRNPDVLRRYDWVELQTANNRVAELRAQLAAANSKVVTAERATETVQARLEARTRQLAAAEADAAAARQTIALLESQMAGMLFVMAGARKWLCSKITQDFATFWQASPSRSVTLPAPLPHAPRILSLPRPILARILATRSGHGDFSAYHDRFNHTSAAVRCRCGAHTAPLHSLYCRLATKKEMLRTAQGQALTPAELVATEKGAAILGARLQATNYYTTAARTNP